ncbi:MAG TPA: glycosyltransferase family 1 protein [Patescibacteria group bacterium]|nr:glycosyltransferase family 1 protein [Patescibacteria group bacterium]
MKKIGIDARLLGQTGVGRYISNLLFYLPSSSKITFYIYVYNKKHLKDILYNSPNALIRETPYHWHSISEQTVFLRKLNKDNLDLMHFTYFSYPFFYRRKFIITLHDLIPFFYRTGKATTGNQMMYTLKHFFYTLLIRNAVKNACAIITPSQQVKKDISHLFGKKYENKIYSLYEGVDKHIMNVHENISMKQRFPLPFYIYVGNFYPHKNIENLIKAFAQLNTQVQLVLLGPSDFFSARILQFIKRLKCDKKIILLNNPTDEDLVFFYKNALALIHPSFAEGFGLPLLEAAYFNCPIVASDIPVFNEILDGHFIKFSPHDLNSIKNAIQQHIANPQKFNYQELLKRFSFKKMAKETYILYEKNV